jgi:hypothetical protein
LPKDRHEVSLNPGSYIEICLPRRHAHLVLAAMRRGRSPLRTMQIFGFIGLLGGCSVSMPMASLMPNPHDDEPTGAIAKPQLANWLVGDDWQSAKTAFSRALAENNASAITWDNPKSGTKGTFVAVGDAYQGASGPCRAFHAEIDRQAAQAPDESLEGIACAGTSGDWQVTEVKPAKQS